MADEKKQGGGLGGGLGDLVKAESMIQLAIALPAGGLSGWVLGSWAGGGDVVKGEWMIQLAIALPGGCLIGWLLGSWADRHFHEGWMGIAGIVLGAVGGFIQIFTLASRYLKRGE